MIPAGRLRHPVTIEQVTNTQNPQTGEITETWTAIASEWAAIEGINGREFVQSNALQAETTYRITMRKRALDTAMRIVSDGVTYGIEAILPDNRETQITVMAKII